MATLKCPLTYSGKGENWHLLPFHCRYFNKILQNCSLFSPLPNISFESKHLNLIGCHGNQEVKFMKNIKKSHPQKPSRG